MQKRLACLLFCVVTFIPERANCNPMDGMPTSAPNGYFDGTRPMRVNAPWLDFPKPQLTPSQEARKRLWLLELTRNKNAAAMYVIPLADALLNHPQNAASRPRNGEQALQLIHGAVIAKNYEHGNRRHAQLLPVPALPSWDPILPFVPERDKTAYETARSEFLEALDKSRIPRLLKSVTRAADVATAANHFFGGTFEDSIYPLRRQQLTFLEDSAFRIDSKRFHFAWQESDGGISRLEDSMARLIACSESDPVCRALIDDPNRTDGLQAIPSVPMQQLERDPRFEQLLKEYRAANRHHRPLLKVPDDAEPRAQDLMTPEDEEKLLGAVIARLRQFEAENRELDDRIKALENKQVESDGEAHDVSRDMQELTKRKLENSRRARMGTELAISCMAHLGVSDTLVRDLSMLSTATFNVADGIILLGPKLSNPLGWLSILNGLTSLLSIGPNTQQLILEQLAEIRQELADFRHETRLNFRLIREENRSYTQKILDRIEQMEYHLAREIGAVRDQARWNEYRIQRIEGQISALSQQILTRFAELHQKDIIGHLASRDLDREMFLQLEREPGRTELRVQRYQEALTSAYAAAVHHSSNHTLAGGDFVVPGSFGTAAPHLSASGPRHLLPLIQHPTAPWSNVNDFLGLAAAAGITIDRGQEPAHVKSWDALNQLSENGTKSYTPKARPGRLGFPPDTRRVVNPIAWSLAARAYVDLASDCPTYFSNQPDYVRGLLEIYQRGEAFNDAMHQVATAPQGSVFGPVLHAQFAAIDQLENLLSTEVEQVRHHLGGIDPWGDDDKRQLPDGDYVAWRGPNTLWQKALIDEGYDPSGAAGSYDFSKAECERLIKDGLISRAFCFAMLINPELGRGPSQTFFGGSIEFSVTQIELPDEYIRYRGSRRESTGFLGTGAGKYHNYVMYGGPIMIVFEARYRTASNALDFPIFRKRVPTRRHVFFRKEGQRTFNSYDSSQSFYQAIQDLQRGRPDYSYSRPLQFHSPADREQLQKFAKRYGDSEGFKLMPILNECWSELKEDLFNPAIGKLAPTDQLLSAEVVERAIQERVAFELFDFENEKDEVLRQGLGKAGDLVKEVVACQGVMYRFLQLLHTEAAQDPEIYSLLLGDQAAWGGVAILKRFTPDESGNASQMIEDNRIVLTETMRAQTVRLQATLGEVLGRLNALPEPIHHPAVDATLVRIVVAARRMGIDLQAELEATGVSVPSHWTCRNLGTILARLVTF